MPTPLFMDEVESTRNPEIRSHVRAETMVRAQPAEISVRSDARAPESGADTSASQQRLRSIIEQHYDFLWRSLRRLGVPAASVEDAAQQVLIVLARRISEIAQGAERSFLFGAAMRVASDCRRKLARNREVVDDDALDGAQHPAADAEELLHRRDRRRLLDMVLEQLPTDLRTVFILFEFEEMTMVSIAEMLDVPLGTVASRLRRAREKFEGIANMIRKVES